MIRRGLVAALLVFVGTGAASSAEPVRLGENLQLVPLSDDAFVVDQIAEPYQANALLVKTPGGALVLVDTPNRESDAALLYAWMRRSLGDGRLTVVNSHFHPDSTGSNAFFRKQGAEILASDEAARRLRREGSEPLLPTVEFPLAKPPVLERGGESIEIVFPGPAHSPEGVVVWFPKRKLLFGSCLSKVGDGLGYLEDANVETWPAAMRRLAQLGATTLVPGHGHRYDPGVVAHTLRLLDAER